MTPHRAALAGQLFDHLVAHSSSTMPEMCRALGRRERITEQAIRDLRAILGTGDTINVVATPNGRGQPWRYELAACSMPSKWWESNRVVDLHSRVETVRSVVTSMLTGLDGRTVDGRGQRLFKAALDNILTTLDAIA